jgi:DNA-directed RNA polymerase subunit RPC12/RpoP
MIMADWHCFKCKEKMVPGEIKFIYLEIEGAQEGIVCPTCNAKYITEEVAVDRMAKGEKMIENK